jgi:DNA-binding PadR family transcriptional regulator
VTPLSGLAFHVLLALGEGPSHGYAIGKDVEERSGGRLDPTTGSLYQVLQRLAADGLIAAAKTPASADERRKYFALTARGRRAAAEEAARFDALVRVARRRKLYPQRA